MKYQININQLILADTELDLVDMAILDYLIFYCNSYSQKIDKERISVDGERYTWVNYESLIEDMPALRIKSTNSLTPRIHAIQREGFIKTKLGKHKRLYICLTEKIDTLFIKNRQDDQQKSSERLLETGVNRHNSKNRQNDHDNNTNDNYTSDNILANKSQAPKEIKKYERKPPEKQTQLQRICYDLEDTLQTKIVNWGKQAKALDMMLKAGYTERQIIFTIHHMADDNFYLNKGFDLMTVANNISHVKATIRKRKEAIDYVPGQG